MGTEVLFAVAATVRRYGFTILFFSSSTTTLGLIAAASSGVQRPKAMMITMSPGVASWAAAPRTTTAPEPASPGTA